MLLERSEQINELAGALAKIQGQMKSAPKDRVNPFFKSKYATLDSVWDACRSLLEKNGVSVVQLPFFQEGMVVVEQIVMHSSGQWIGSRLHLRPEKDNPQSVGSAITYARRYLLGASLGITTDEDDDGNAATSDRKKNNQPRADHKNGNGNGDFSPDFLLNTLNKIEKINGFYSTGKEILTLLKRDNWPPKEDDEGWRQLFIDARDYAIQALGEEQSADKTQAAK